MELFIPLIVVLVIGIVLGIPFGKWMADGFYPKDKNEKI